MFNALSAVMGTLGLRRVAGHPSAKSDVPLQHSPARKTRDARCIRMQREQVQGRAVFVLLACSSAVSMASAEEAGRATAMAECASRAPATVLVPAAGQATDARAHWLDSSLLKWPKVGRNDRFRLHYSADAQLLAQAGKPVSGADGALALDAFEGELPLELAQRFAFVADGVVLSLDAQDAGRLPALLAQQVLLVQEDEAGRVIDATSVQVAGALDDLYAGAAHAPALGVSVSRAGTGFKLWAPTARRVSLCVEAANGLAAMPRASGRCSIPAITPATTTSTWWMWSCLGLAWSGIASPIRIPSAWMPIPGAVISQTSMRPH
jgi:Pullulanase N2 domain